MNNLPKLALLMIIILAGIAVAWLGGITAPNNRLGWFMLVAGLSSCLVGLLHLAIAQYRQRIKSDATDRSL